MSLEYASTRPTTHQPTTPPAAQVPRRGPVSLQREQNERPKPRHCVWTQHPPTQDGGPGHHHGRCAAFFTKEMQLLFLFQSVSVVDMFSLRPRGFPPGRCVHQFLSQFEETNMRQPGYLDSKLLVGVDVSVNGCFYLYAMTLTWVKPPPSPCVVADDEGIFVDANFDYRSEFSSVGVTL